MVRADIFIRFFGSFYPRGSFLRKASDGQGHDSELSEGGGGSVIAALDGKMGSNYFKNTGHFRNLTLTTYFLYLIYEEENDNRFISKNDGRTVCKS